MRGGGGRLAKDAIAAATRRLCQQPLPRLHSSLADIFPQLGKSLFLAQPLDAARLPPAPTAAAPSPLLPKG